MDIEKIWIMARGYAAKRGYEQDAEDFAQEYSMLWLENPKRLMQYCFVDYLRAKYGRPEKNPSAGARYRFNNTRHIPLDADHGEGRLNAELYGDMRWNGETETLKKQGVARLKGLNQREQVIATKLLEGFTQKEIGKSLGITESRVSQLVQHIIWKLEKGNANG